MPKSEFYVINLVRGDDEACHLVAKYLGLFNLPTPNRVINELASRRASYPLAERDKIFFDELRKKLDKEQGVLFEPSIEPLTDNDFRWLLETKEQQRIGELIGYASSEVLQYLFPPEPLARLLVNAGIIEQHHAIGTDSEWLLAKFVSENSRPKLVRFLGTTSRWELLQTDLLSNQARRDLARVLDCSEEETLTHLIAYLKKPELEREGRSFLVELFGPGDGFDFIGLSKLRHLMHTFQDAIREQIKDQADFAKARLPGYRISMVLPTLVRFYICREFKTALGDLLTTNQPLRQIITNLEKKVEVITPTLEVHKEARLEVIIRTEEKAIDAGESFQAVERSKVGRLEEIGDLEGNTADLIIQCCPKLATPPVELIRLRNLEQAELEHIRKHLPRTVADLSQAGISLPDRVLNTLLPLFPQWRQRLREAITQPDTTSSRRSVSDAFIQCFVLSKASLRPEILKPDLEISDYPRIDNSPSAFVEFPKNVQDIVASLKKEYAQNGKPLKQIQL